MFDKLGLPGVAGILACVLGLGIVAWQNVLLATGLALVVGGVGLVVYGLLQSVLASFGMAGGMP